MIVPVNTPPAVGSGAPASGKPPGSTTEIVPSPSLPFGALANHGRPKPLLNEMPSGRLTDGRSLVDRSRILDAVDEGGTLRRIQNDFAADRARLSTAASQSLPARRPDFGAAADVDRQDRARRLQRSRERRAEVRGARDEQSSSVEDLPWLRRRGERRIVVKRSAGVKLPDLRDRARAGNSGRDDVGMDRHGIVGDPRRPRALDAGSAPTR